MADQSKWEDFRLRGEMYRANEEALRMPDYDEWWRPFADAWWSLYHVVRGIPQGIRFVYQRQTRGYSDNELWGLNSSITKYVYPRIKEFARWQGEHGVGTPMEFEHNPAEWLNVLNKMTRAFHLLAAEDYLFGLDPDEENPFAYRKNFNTDDEYHAGLQLWRARHAEHEKEIEEGLTLFTKYYRGLWD